MANSQVVSARQPMRDQRPVTGLGIALDLDPGTPVVLCDARDRESVKNVLITLVRHVLTQTSPAAEYQSAPLPAR